MAKRPAHGDLIQTEILALLGAAGPLSRAEVAHRLSLGAATVTDHTRRLIGEGFLRELEPRASGTGRPRVPQPRAVALPRPGLHGRDRRRDDRAATEPGDHRVAVAGHGARAGRGLSPARPQRSDHQTVGSARRRPARLDRVRSVRSEGSVRRMTRRRHPSFTRPKTSTSAMLSSTGDALASHTRT